MIDPNFDPLLELQMCHLELQNQKVTINNLIAEYNHTAEIILEVAKSNEILSKVSARDSKRIMALEKRLKQLEDAAQ